jgi:hypothetical protein
MRGIICCCVVFALNAKTTQQQIFSFFSQKAFPIFEWLFGEGGEKREYRKKFALVFPFK